MAFDYNTIIPFILPITSGLALIISIFSVSYTYYQNKRKIEVDLWIDSEKERPLITICIYNPGFRSVALIKFKYLVNNEPVIIVKGKYKSNSSKYDGASHYRVNFDKMIDFPYILKEGEAVFITQRARNLATALYYKDYPNVVKLSAQFETAQKKIYKSKSTVYLDTGKLRSIDEDRALKLKLNLR